MAACIECQNVWHEERRDETENGEKLALLLHKCLP